MNYLPIFSPVFGTISSVSSDSMIISIGCRKNIFSTVFGKINVTVSDDTYNINFNNEYLENPIIITINGQADTFVEDYNVEYNEQVATNITGTICKINFGKVFIPLVDKGCEIRAGNTAIGYIKIKQKILIKSDPKQLVILTIPYFIIYGQNLQQSYAYDLPSRRMVDKLKNTLTNVNYDICLYLRNMDQTCDTPYPKAIQNRIKMKINEIKLSELTPSELNIIYILDCSSFRPKSFQNIRIKDPDVCILFADCQQLLMIDELADTLKDNGIMVTKYISHGDTLVKDFFDYNFEYELDKYYTTIVPIIIKINETIPDTKISIITHAIHKWMSTINLYIHQKFSDRSALK